MTRFLFRWRRAYVCTFLIGEEIVAYQVITHYFIGKNKNKACRGYVKALLCIAVAEIVLNVSVIIMGLMVVLFTVPLAFAAIGVEIAYFAAWLRHRKDEIGDIQMSTN